MLGSTLWIKMISDTVRSFISYSSIGNVFLYIFDLDEVEGGSVRPSVFISSFYNCAFHFVVFLFLWQVHFLLLLFFFHFYTKIFIINIYIFVVVVFFFVFFFFYFFLSIFFFLGYYIYRGVVVVMSGRKKKERNQQTFIARITGFYLIFSLSYT